MFVHCSKSAYFLESSKAGSVGFFSFTVSVWQMLGAAHSSVLLVSLCSCLCDSLKKCFYFVFHFSLGIVYCALIAQMFLVEFFLFIFYLF